MNTKKTQYVTNNLFYCRIIQIALFFIIALGPLSAHDALKKTTSVVNSDSVFFNTGWNLGAPMALYANNSVSGIDIGYQTKHTLIRASGWCAFNFLGNGKSNFALPSIGVFYTKNWTNGFRTFAGIQGGVEVGMTNSFDGILGFFSLLNGLEFFCSNSKSFFIEIGTGVGFPSKENAYNGGVITGGGMKIYFR